MDRRKSIKALIIGTVSAGTLVDACSPSDKKAEEQKKTDAVTTDGINRMKEETEYYKEVISKTFFTPEEMATITILADIIIPKDDVSGSASDAKVSDFMEFIVKDMPEHQTPLRGGLRWLDVMSLKHFEKPFKDCTHEQQMQMVDMIAWPKKAKPEHLQGVAFFNLMRNLTATGFYTTQMGYKDVGYMGNIPNQWNGVPAEVLKQYKMAYTEKELKECVNFDKA
jgi:gluconate 2-dehydrogenase gamma chain